MQVPPYNTEAEKSILGSMILRAEIIPKVISFGVNPEFFYLDLHKNIFTSIIEISQTSEVDPISVTDHLSKKEVFSKDREAEQKIYVWELQDRIPTTANVLNYCSIIRSCYLARRIQNAASTAFEKSSDPWCLAETLEELEGELFEIKKEAEKESKKTSAKDIIKDYMGDLHAMANGSRENKLGASTPWESFSKVCVSLFPGAMTIIAGRPAMGKTALGLEFLLHFGIDLQKVSAIFSLEMGAEQLMNRLVSMRSRVNNLHLKDPANLLDTKDLPRILKAATEIKESKISIFDQSAQTPQSIRATCKRLEAEEGELGVVIVDYLQLMASGKGHESTKDEVSAISRALRSLAKDLKCPIIALSQLNRNLEKRTDKRPIMSDLKEAGAIEEDAEMILFVYRDEIYDENSPDKGIAELIVGKQRGGSIGTTSLRFRKEYTKFEEQDVFPKTDSMPIM